MLGLECQKLLVDLQSFLRQRCVGCVFLIQTAEIEVCARKPGSELNGVAKIRFCGCKVILLGVDHAQQIVDPRIAGKRRRQALQFAPGTSQVAGLDRLLDSGQTLIGGIVSLARL